MTDVLILVHMTLPAGASHDDATKFVKEAILDAHAVIAREAYAARFVDPSETHPMTGLDRTAILVAHRKV